MEYRLRRQEPRYGSRPKWDEDRHAFYARYWSPARRAAHSRRMKAKAAEEDGSTRVTEDPKRGLGHLDRAPARTFEECWRRARDPQRRRDVGID